MIRTELKKNRFSEELLVLQKNRFSEELLETKTKTETKDLKNDL